MPPICSVETRLECGPEMGSMTVLNGNYDYRLAALSIMLAMCASYAAFELARRRTWAGGWGRALSLFDRLIAARKGNLEIARERESHFQTMTNAIPGMIWTARPDGSVDFASHQLLEYGGVKAKDLDHWPTLLHPDDVATTLSAWEHSTRTGEAHEIEYRLRRVDGTYRWFLVRGNPMRNEKGEITKWFGTCTDIEDQKHTQQILEEQIKERTEQLADTNTRLQEEMLEKDFARDELDRQNERMVGELTERT